MAKWKGKYGKNHPTKAGQFRSSRGIKQDRNNTSEEDWENTKIISSARLNKIKPLNFKSLRKY